MVFRNRKRADIDYAVYEAEADLMLEVAKRQPGYLSFKSYAADDGEAIALSVWTDGASARAWGKAVEHRAVQSRGRSAYHESYTREVGWKHGDWRDVGWWQRIL